MHSTYALIRVHLQVVLYTADHRVRSNVSPHYAKLLNMGKRLMITGGSLSVGRVSCTLFLCRYWWRRQRKRVRESPLPQVLERLVEVAAVSAVLQVDSVAVCFDIWHSAGRGDWKWEEGYREDRWWRLGYTELIQEFY